MRFEVALIGLSPLHTPGVNSLFRQQGAGQLVLLTGALLGVMAARFLRLCGQYLFPCLAPSTRPACTVQVCEDAGCQEAHCTM